MLIPDVFVREKIHSNRESGLIAMKERFFCRLIPIIALCASAVFSQIVTDPLPYAPIANPLPDTMDQLYRDSINLVFSPIRINQAGYRPQDKKYFYYVGSGASGFSVINEAGETVGSGTLTATGSSTSGQLKIKASNNAQLVNNGDTRYTMESPLYSGDIYEGLLPELPQGTYQVVVGSARSAKFVIDEHLYSWVRDALLKFYGANRCGDSQSWFHDACHLKDAVTGGWHDCGDHLKEGATMGYTASVLGLAAAAFAENDTDCYSANHAITQVTDGIPDMLYEAKHGADFVLRSYDLAGGQVGNMITSVGDYGMDHMWWGRPEYQDEMPTERGGPPRAARNEATSDYLGNYAANLAFVSKMYRPYDSTYSNRCLTAAKAIYAFTKGRRDRTNTPAYNGSTNVSDDLAFACLGLLWATGERSYLDELCYDKTIGVNGTDGNKALFEGGWFTYYDRLFSHATTNTDWGSVQAHVLWGFFRLVLNDQTFCESLGLTEEQRLALIEKTVYNLICNLSSAGLGTQTIQLPPTGIWVESTIRYDKPWFTMFTPMEWVWNRYQSGNITEMFYYYDIASRIQGMELPNTPATTDWKAEEMKTILVRMLDYQLGVNPWDISMIYGVGEKNFNHPHHRAANPEGKNVPGAFYGYTPPVGALQGGYKPTTTIYDEFWSDYFHSETGIDGTTNIFMPVVGLAKKITLGPPSGTVRIVYVGCDEAIIEVRQSRFGTALVRYGAETVIDKVERVDSSGVFHRIRLGNLTPGTKYIFDVVVTDAFGREGTIKYIDEEKRETYFTFTTLQNCPTDAEIANVKVCRVTHDSAEIFWYTPNGDFNSRVVYGTQKPPVTVHDGDVAGHPVKFHYVKIGGLTEQTTYYFYVESGDSRDDNKGELYTFTTPVEHVDFDVRTLRYTWQDMTTLGMNIVNQDKKAYDSLDVRVYFRAKEGFENDLGMRMDIGIVYKEDGFQSEFSENGDIRYNIMHSRPVKMEDTYNDADQTYAYYLSVPLWGVEMRSGSRIRLDLVFDRRSPFPPYEDLMNQAPEHVITDLDWSFGPHSREAGDPVDFPGVPNMPKENVDSDYWTQPINYYVTIYRKGEYVWGYSPSQEETKKKKNYYTLTTQVTTPLNNPSADYVFLEAPSRTVNVSGWATVEPIDGSLNDIWINGVKQTNISSMFSWNENAGRYDFTVPVPVKNGRNNVDITLFAGPAATCVDCYGCAVSNHSFYIEYQGAKQIDAILVLRDNLMKPLLSDTVKPDTSSFHVVVTDPNGNVSGKAVDLVRVWIVNLDNGDSIEVTLTESGDSTGIFQTTVPIAVVDRTPDQSGESQIAMNGGDRVRIRYIDPTDSTDTAEVYIASKANFPLARSGYLRDSNGDGSADQLVVVYSTELKTNIDSVSVGFPSASTPHMARLGTDEITFSGKTVTVGFAQPLADGVTGFTSAIFTNGTSYLTSAGLVKSTGFQVFDSMGPVLNGQAVVRELAAASDDVPDTLTITISEGVNISTLQGGVLLLRRGGVEYPVQIITALSMESGTNVVTVLCNTAGLHFAVGDSLRFDPAGPLVDLSTNGPHLSNRAVPVVITATMGRLTYAYYLDTDFNGVVDLMKIGFSKEIAPQKLGISLKWNDRDAVTLTPDMLIPVGVGGVDFDVTIPPSVTGGVVSTGGGLGAILTHADYPDENINQTVVDSAPPVIFSATFGLYNGEIGSAAIIDTLRIVFSEPVRVASVERTEGFDLFRPSVGPYTFSVASFHYIAENEYVFLGTVQGVSYPVPGDSIRLQPASALADTKGTPQTSPLNRHVAVFVRQPELSLKNVDIRSGPNPFDPHFEEFVISITPKAMRFPITIDSTARAVIHDKVGNMVITLTSVQTQGGVEIRWSGTNRRGRIVGNGTYLCFFTFFKGSGDPLKVAVRRRR